MDERLSFTYDEGFRQELASLINRYSMEREGGNTPDFILADLMIGSLRVFGVITQERERWYGRGEEVSQLEIDSYPKGV